MIRAGWTLHEMLVSLSIMGAVAALAAHAAVGQLHFFQGVVDVTAVRSQVSEVGAIVAAVVWGVAPADGEILVAQDSALEVAAPVGVAVNCVSGVGVVTTAMPEARGNSLGSTDAAPEPGDVARLLVADSSGSTWLNVTVSGAPALGAACQSFPDVRATQQISLREPLLVPVGAVLRWTRRIRLTLYRASDARWYLGAREWNVASQRFNTIQPVAGPVLSYSANAPMTGLRFQYHASDGGLLDPPADLARIAAISVTTRAEAWRRVRLPGRAASADRYVDSSSVTIGLRNAR